MKKYIFAISLVVATLTSCDPTVEDEGVASGMVSSAELENIVTLTQTVANQNKFTYKTTPATTIQILDPNGNILITGTSGAFDINPGGEVDQTYTIRAVNQDGTTAAIKKSYTISEYVDVAPQWEYLCGDSKKTWTYDVDLFGGGWGNLGYQAGDFVNDRAGLWFACDPDALSGQIQHSDTGVLTGEESSKATMVFSLSGTKILKYDADGKQIGTGTFTFDMTPNKEGWDTGTLTTSAGAILFPFKINGGGYKPTAFQIMKLDDNNMVLVYADKGTGSWSEATFWSFKAVK